MDKENFMKAALSWIKLHGAVGVSALGSQTEDGTKSVISARVTIGAGENIPLPPDMRNSFLWARKEAFKKSGEEICSMIETLMDGKLPLRDGIIPLHKKQTNQPYSTYCDLSYGNRYISESTAPRCFKFIIKGDYASGFNSSENDHLLRVGDEPFSDLDEVCDYYGAPPIQNEALIEVIINPPVSFSASCRIEGGSADISINVNGKFNYYEDHGIKVGFIRRGGDPKGSRGVAGDIKWMQRHDGVSGSVSIPMENSSHIDLFLSCRGEMAHSIRLHNKEEITSPARTIYSEFDPDDKALSSVLFSRDKSLSRQFEEAFSVLLHLLGFSVAHYGGIKAIGDCAPDVIAHSSSGSIAVIECTVGLPNQGDQVAKILQRTSAIKSIFKDRKEGPPAIHSIIVTNLSESEISTHGADAERAGVAVICREGIEELLNHLDTLMGTDKILEKMIMRRHNSAWARKSG